MLKFSSFREEPRTPTPQTELHTRIAQMENQQAVWFEKRIVTMLKLFGCGITSLIHVACHARFQVREITVSHWGSVAFEDSLDISQTGALLKGFFSRYEFQQNPRGIGPSAVKVLKATMPANAHDIYYRDETGNISTSTVIREDSSTIVEAVPRFPLFGGWKTAVTMGYSVPLADCLKSDKGSSDMYRLQVDFGVLFEKMHADSHTVRIVLPEGASDIRVEAPFAVEESRSHKVSE